MKIWFAAACALWLVGGELRAGEGELWVAVGDSGRRISSKDGDQWEHDQQWEEAKGDLVGVAFGLHRFIAVGGDAKQGIMLRSNDGIHWQELPFRDHKVGCITFGQGRFVAAQGTQLLLSEDGETFTAGAKIEQTFATESESAGTLVPLKIACGDTEAGFRFVIIGRVQSPTNDQQGAWRAVCGDGTRIEHFSSARQTSDIAYGAGHFVAVGPGMIESSHDGETWVHHPTSESQLSSVVWTGTRFVATDGVCAWVSPDALNWSRENRPSLTLNWARDTPPALYLGWDKVGATLLSRDLRLWQSLAAQPRPTLRAFAHRPATP